ncbi:Chloride channel protein CLC-e [Morus notabilis]|uniref:Chloride channel protein n=1 Tax=Morus notabilis TaxID=981085 RepID=W9QWK2_9ROSA|nr:Chloride channel protein CLC-e [Morus notabilis]
MAAMEFAWQLPNSQLSIPYSTKSSQILHRSSSSSTSKRNSLFVSYSSSTSKNGRSRTSLGNSSSIKLQILLRPPFALSQSRQSQSSVLKEEENGEQGEEQEQDDEGLSNDNGQGNSTVILSSCLIGLLTGIGVVLFNNGVHEIRDLFWDGIPYRGASWLREEPIGEIWKRVILVPASGGLIVGFINVLQSALEDDNDDDSEKINGGRFGGSGARNSILDGLRAASRPFLKAVAACVTLGTGNSLGPEGPSVEIGTSIAKGVNTLLDKTSSRKLSLVAAGSAAGIASGPSVEIGTSIAKGVNTLLDKTSSRKLSLVAAGSAAGIASGFNAAVAGCFFAVESVLWPSPSDPSSMTLTNTTSMVILSAVVGSVVSEVGMGSEPAFKVPEYDFRSPTELPLYLLLGLLCGLVSLALSKCTSYLVATVDDIHKNTGVPKASFPLLGGLAVGLIALAYPEILYWGFENVDILLESRPFVKGLSADLLLQLVAVKILTTSLCRASGLVGGYYAPSLFIGAATGMAYGKIICFAVAQPNPIIDLSILEVATPQAYGLVGMAATLAGVCQVPLTAVLLLFELTQDYRIVLPLLGAVGLSSWVTSGQMRRREAKSKKKLKQGKTREIQQPDMLPSGASGLPLNYAPTEKKSNMSDLCEIESSLCIDESDAETEDLGKKILVSEAMRTRYVTVLMNTMLTEALNLMLTEKQPCAMIVDHDNILIGLLTLSDIEEFSKYTKSRSRRSEELLVSEMCSLDGEKCRIPWAATPSMDLLSVNIIMNRRGLNQVPVSSSNERVPVLANIANQKGQFVKIIGIPDALSFGDSFSTLCS